MFGSVTSIPRHTAVESLNSCPATCLCCRAWEFPFDPWKDPLGVIEAYRLVKREIRDVQLVLIGAMAGDDPEGWQLLDRVQEESAHDPDLFVFTNVADVGSMEVNVFQRGCDVVMQKSLREGFGLVVSEALWKKKPVVAGRAGGIPLQFPEGFDRYLIDNVED
jgi:trehalose synthase